MPNTTAAQAFFNPTDPFSLGAGWAVQTDNPTTNRQKAQALGSDGDQIAEQTYDEKSEISAEYVATAADAAIPSCGAVAGGYHIDSVDVRYTNNDYARMTVAGHKHLGTGVTSHAVGSCRTYTGPLETIGVLFGCPAAPTGFVIPTGAGVRSYNYRLQLNHVDEPGSTGNFLAGDNYDGSVTASVELCEMGTIAAASGWTLMTDGHARSNTTAETASATAEMHLAHDTE